MNTNLKSIESHEEVLEAIVSEIEITDEMEVLARKRYKLIGNWLDDEKSEIKQFNPVVSPHGSFIIGTVIRPITDSDDFDIDLMCKLNASKSDFSMYELKRDVGKELFKFAESKNFEKEPDDNRHCWTLEYNDEVNFHVDIVPCLPNKEGFIELLASEGFNDLANNPSITKQAIAITDKDDEDVYFEKTENWPASNPKGFATWFHFRQQGALFNNNLGIENEINARVDDVPKHKIKTPLQKAIQLLKRHRDVMFDGNDDKPASIIITTLCATLYDNEKTIVETLENLLMENRIENEISTDEDGFHLIKNPINPTENFAKKWKETPEKAENFFDWLDQVRRDFGLYLGGNSKYDEFPENLRKSLSYTTVDRVLSKVHIKTSFNNTESILKNETDHSNRHRKPEKPWVRW